MTERKEEKRQFLVILTIIFLGFIGISMPYLIFPPLFLNLDYTFLPTSWGASSRGLFLGITLAAYPLGQFVGSPILGALSDDYGRKRLLSVSLVCAAFSYLLTGIAIAWQHLGLLIFSRLIAGLMEGNVAIARAMVADFKLLSKPNTFGKISATTSIAYLIGPLLGGLTADKELVQWFDTYTPFFFISVLFACLAVLSALVLQKSVIRTSVIARTVWERINFIRRVSALFANKQLKFVMIVATCFTLAVDIYYEFGPVYLTLKWELGPAQLIWYNGVLCLGLAIGNGLLPTFMSSRITAPTSILTGIGGFVLLMIGIIYTNSMFWMLLCFGLSGLFIGLAVTLLTVKISDTAPDAIQGEVMGTQLSLRVLGDGIICLLGGLLLAVSPRLILLLAVVIAIVTFLYYRAKQKKF